MNPSTTVVLITTSRKTYLCDKIIGFLIFNNVSFPNSCVALPSEILVPSTRELFETSKGCGR